MRYIIQLFLLSFLSLPFTGFTQELDKSKNYTSSIIAFYNLENLFDTIVDPDTTMILQDEFTPHGKNNWTGERYFRKLDNMASVVAQLGAELNADGPAILGVAEVENKSVLEDFAKRKDVKSKNYQIIHYDSPDKRGIDVAMLYNPKYFEVESSKKFRLTLPDRDDYFSRDQLLVTGKLQGERVHVIVAHWPSRRGGQKKSSFKREEAGKLGRTIVDSILKVEPQAKIFYMGDLNDDPTNASVKKALSTAGKKNQLLGNQLFNPYETFYKNGIGSLAWRDTWNLFDQIIVSSELLPTDFSTYQYYSAKVFNKDFLKTQEGRYKGYPKRTYAGGNYAGGYSDHFPVYLFLVKEVK